MHCFAIITIVFTDVLPSFCTPTMSWQEKRIKGLRGIRSSLWLESKRSPESGQAFDRSRSVRRNPAKPLIGVEAFAGIRSSLWLESKRSPESGQAFDRSRSVRRNPRKPLTGVEASRGICTSLWLIFSGSTSHTTMAVIVSKEFAKSAAYNSSSCTATTRFLYREAISRPSNRQSELKTDQIPVFFHTFSNLYTPFRNLFNRIRNICPIFAAWFKSHRELITLLI